MPEDRGSDADREPTGEEPVEEMATLLAEEGVAFEGQSEVESSSGVEDQEIEDCIRIDIETQTGASLNERDDISVAASRTIIPIATSKHAFTLPSKNGHLPSKGRKLRSDEIEEEERSSPESPTVSPETQSPDSYCTDECKVLFRIQP